MVDNCGSFEHPSFIVVCAGSHSYRSLFIVLDPTVQSNYAIQFRLLPMAMKMLHS